MAHSEELSIPQQPKLWNFEDGTEIFIYLDVDDTDHDTIYVHII